MRADPQPSHDERLSALLSLVYVTDLIDRWISRPGGFVVALVLPLIVLGIAEWRVRRRR